MCAQEKCISSPPKSGESILAPKNLNPIFGIPSIGSKICIFSLSLWGKCYLKVFAGVTKKKSEKRPPDHLVADPNVTCIDFIQSFLQHCHPRFGPDKALCLYCSPGQTITLIVDSAQKKIQKKSSSPWPRNRSCRCFFHQSCAPHPQILEVVRKL